MSSVNMNSGTSGSSLDTSTGSVAKAPSPSASPAGKSTTADKSGTTSGTDSTSEEYSVVDAARAREAGRQEANAEAADAPAEEEEYVGPTAEEMQAQAEQESTKTAQRVVLGILTLGLSELIPLALGGIAQQPEVYKDNISAATSDSTSSSSQAMVSAEDEAAQTEAAADLSGKAAASNQSTTTEGSADKASTKAAPKADKPAAAPKGESADT